MARTKYRFTGFTRFFVVMLIVVPLAYLGAAWYNGEDGLANIKRWLGMDDTTEVVEPQKPTPQNPVPEQESTPDRSTSEPDASYQAELEYYKRRVEELENENNRLRERVWEAEQEVARLKQNE